MSDLRDRDEIQRAHDLLTGLVLEPGLLDLLYGAEGDPRLVALQANVLCWVLKHEHNVTFARHLADLERRLADAGIEVYKAPVVVTPVWKEPS